MFFNCWQKKIFVITALANNVSVAQIQLVEGNPSNSLEQKSLCDFFAISRFRICWRSCRLRKTFHHPSTKRENFVVLCPSYSVIISSFWGHVFLRNKNISLYKIPDRQKLNRDETVLDYLSERKRTKPHLSLSPYILLMQVVPIVY